jgi:hypothetical protein
MKCVVYNCKNDSEHKKFKGDICTHCYAWITKRKGDFSQAQINEIMTTIETLKAFVSTLRKTQMQEADEVLEKLNRMVK